MENFKSYPNQRVVPPQQLLDADLPDENPFMGRFLRSFVFLFMILGVYLGKLYGTVYFCFFVTFNHLLIKAECCGSMS